MTEEDIMIEITITLVQKLVASQFPQYNDLEIIPVEQSGHDNRTFHLGNQMVVRLPSAPGYALQPEKENEWLPLIASQLDYEVTLPIHIGNPEFDYPFHWTINKWIQGKTVAEDKDIDKIILAIDLSKALKKLQAIDTKNGPVGGLHNYYRGCSLEHYHDETISAINNLGTVLPAITLEEIWQLALSSEQDTVGVWVHGDIAPTNILVRKGKFVALIDFGCLAVGDPACDYAMAWTYFNIAERKYFLRGLDKKLVNRARGWALWKALITYESDNDTVKSNAVYAINEIIKETSYRY